MSTSTEPSAALDQRAADIAADLATAIEADQLDVISDDRLGQLFASIVRFYAERAQRGPAPDPFGRNSGITRTEVLIGCSAMLDGVDLPAFELSQWQAWSKLGRLARAEPDIGPDED